MKKLIFPVFLFLGITMLLSVVSAEIFHIDDRFKVGWTDGTDNYEAEYKVWKIEEQSGQNITILVHASTGSIAIHSLNGLTTSLGASSKLIINQIYVSGDDRWISISLQNAQFKESTTAPTSPSSGGGGGGGTTNNTGGGGQGGGCYDTDGGKDYYEKGIAAGVYDSCISKYQLSERYCTNSQGADYIVDWYKNYESEDVYQLSINQIHKYETEIDKTNKIDEVLLTVDEKKVKVGTPNVSGAFVEYQIVNNYQGEKIDVFKFKSKSRYRRSMGFRAQLTDIKITKINL